MYTSKFAKCSFVLALIVGGLFLFSEVSLAQPPAPQILLPRNLKIEKGAVIFKWASTAAVEYAFLLDGNANTNVVSDPGVAGAVERMDVRGLEGVTPQKRYDLGKGEYYFHVAAKNAAGSWSAITHFGPVKVISSSFLIDDFDDGGRRTDPADPTKRINEVNGLTGTLDDEFDSSCTPTYPQNPDDVPAPPGSLPGYSLKLAYNLKYQIMPVSAWAGYKTDLNFWNYSEDRREYLDLSGYQALSFWVKGASSNEKFYIKVQDFQPEGTGPIPTPYTGDLAEIAIGELDNPYLPGGVTTDWKRVVIPLYEFRPLFGYIPDAWSYGPITWSKMYDLSITFEQRIQSGTSGTIYIDNIEFLADYALVDNFDAERPLNSAPYNVMSEGTATITAAYASDGDAYGESGKSLKLTYSVPAPPATGHSKFQYNFPVGEEPARVPLDVSHLSTLGFYVKGANGGESFNVYLIDERFLTLPEPQNAVGRQHVKAVQYVTVRNDDWHYVAIPLEDFKLRGIDLTKIYTLEIVFEWTAMSGTIYIDNIEFTNGLIKKPSTGPVKVEGRRLLVNGLPFTIRGVGYQPTPIGYFPYDPSIAGAQVIDVYKDTPYNQAMWTRDLAKLEEMGVNTIRTWSMLPVGPTGQAEGIAFLNACLDHGIYVIMGFDILNLNYNIFARAIPGGPPFSERLGSRTTYLDDFKKYVNAYKDHPAVLMWAIGNENSYGYGGDVWWDNDPLAPDDGWTVDKDAYLNHNEVIGKRLTMRELFTLVNELARTAYEVEGDKYHPTMCPNGDLLYIGEQHYYPPTTDPLKPNDQVVRVTDSAMNYLDMWGANVYRGDSFLNNPYGIYEGLFNPSGLFKEYEARSTKPFVITEYGIDAYDNDTSGEYEATQASYAIELWNEVMENLDVSVGASIMEYSDEWWKSRDGSWDDAAWVAHSDDQDGADAGAKSPVGNPDKFSNEEWYGIMRPVDNGADPDIMKPRKAYTYLSKKLAKELLVDDFNAPLNPDPVHNTPPATGYPHDAIANKLGGEINVIESPGTVTYLDYDESVRQGADGYSLKIQYNMNDTLPSWAGFWTRFGPAGNEPIDIRGFNTLSFWVKGAVGGEKFRVSLTPDGSEPDGLDHEQETKVSILDYLPEGVNTEWQQVSMPLSAFTKLEDRDKVEQFAIIFETHIQLWENGRWVTYPTGVTDTGAIYIEDIKFERRGKLPVVWVDNFNDTIPTNALQGSIRTYRTGGTISWDYDSAGYSDRCIYTTYDVPDGSHAELNMDLYGVDVSSQDTLTFYLKGKDGGERVHVYLEDGVLYNDAGTWKVQIINRGGVVISEITNEWQKIRIPLSEFAGQGVDLTRLQILSFVFEWGAMAGTIYVDEIRFESVGDITAPTLNPVPQLVNYSPITLSGTKAPYTGIFINGTEAYPVDEKDEWSCAFSLEEGENTLKITARNSAGAQSEEIVKYITYDSSAYLTAPPAGSLHIANDPVGGYRNDSTIHVAVSNYSVGNAQHTGYQVEICRRQDFSEPYATYNYWHNAKTAAGAQFINKYVNFDIDVNQFVGADKVWSTLPSAVYVRVRAARFGFTPSSYDGTKYVSLSSNIFLEAPNSAVLKNDEQDLVIRVEIVPADPRTSGKVIETGYRIDFLPGNKSFDTASSNEMYHAYVNYDGVSTGALPYYIDMRGAVNSGVFTWQELETYGVRARAVSTRKGYTPSAPTPEDSATVKNITRLQNPAQGQVALANADLDRVISFTINNYDPANLGIPTDSITGQNKMNVRHTGYRIDLCKDQNFNEGETYHYDYIYDFEGDSAADEIRAGLPGIGTPTKIRVDVDILSAASVLGYDFVTTSGLKRVYTRVLAIRDGYAVNYENYYKSSANFQNITRLQNPGSHLAVYNKEPANPADKMDRTITVEVENYNPSGVASGINKKNTKHTGYQIEISSSQSFAPVYTYTYLYIYDPENDGVPNEINATITDNIKIHIDLDVSRHGTTIGPPPGYGGPASNMVYVRALAYKAGYTLNYEDLTSPPLTVPFLDRSLLTKPVTVSTTNYANSTASYDIDSSIYVYIAPVTPAGLAHDGYDIKVDVVGKGANGKKYSKTYFLKGLELVSTAIPRQDKTIDVKKLFEVNNNPYKQYNLTGLLDIPANEIYGDEGPPAGTEDVKVTVVSTKEGYTSSASVQAEEVSGGGAWTALVFKNTSNTFLPSLTIDSASNPTGTTITVVLEGYSATSPAPPMGSGVGRVKYEIQCSTDSTFPDDKNVTITDSTADAQTTQTPKDIDVKTLSAIAQRTGDDPVSVYVRARFVKMSYTPKDYPEYPSPEVKTVTIDTLPPMIVDFTATPVAGQASMDVDFTSDVMGSVSSYSWDFGDETPAGTGASPSHTYSASGIYTVTLTATGPAGTDIYEKVDYIKVGDVAVTPGSSVQAAVDSASSGDNIVLIDGDHTGDITIDGKDVILVGASVHGTVIKGNILLKDSDSLIKNLTIRYDKGVEVPYGTDDYFKIVTDAGITAINSAIAVDSCVIMPDPGIFGTDKQGKGIQIWNLSGSAAVEPAIHNNLILNTDAGIYLYSHETGGAILGEVSNNTLDLNNYGITLRMYTENPAIHHNIITRSKDGIHEVYRDLISVRIGNITDNCFGAEAPSGLPEYSFDNERDVWDEQGQSEVIIALPWDTTGKGNIGVYPDFVGPYAPPTLSYDYTPQNPNCDGMGARLPAL